MPPVSQNARIINDGGESPSAVAKTTAPTQSELRAPATPTPEQLIRHMQEFPSPGLKGKTAEPVTPGASKGSAFSSAEFNPERISSAAKTLFAMDGHKGVDKTQTGPLTPPDTSSGAQSSERLNFDTAKIERHYSKLFATIAPAAQAFEATTGLPSQQEIQRASGKLLSSIGDVLHDAGSRISSVASGLIKGLQNDSTKEEK